MNTINIAADATAQRIGIGNQYENEATAVVFDCSQFATDHGAGTAQVVHRRPTESVGYVCTNVTQAGNNVTWLVTDDDTSFTGKGLVQLRWYVDEVLRESVIFPTYILPSVASSDDAPADVKSALEQIMEWVNDNTISTEDLDERIANYFYDHPLPMEGEADGLVAGSAKQLLSDSYTLDQIPYLYRKSPDSDRAVEEIVGGTLGWNQLVRNGNFADTSGWVGSQGTIQISDNACKWTATLTDVSGGIRQGTLNGIEGHKYFCSVNVIPSVSTKCSFYLSGGTALARLVDAPSNTKTRITCILEAGNVTYGMYCYCNRTQQLQVNDTCIFENVNCTDLTTYFGNSTIADYVYNLETTTAGAGIEWLKNNCPKLFEYNEYCEPTLKSVEGLQSKVTRDTDENIIATYPLDSTLTLRGVPKLDSNNSLYFDGDVYSADGSVSRRFTERAYQSGDESLADAITDGTTTVVKLATPTTEIALPYHNPQIVGDTEEWVTTGIVPVGHSTKYYENLRKKIENLPWNFSDLIAPTEVTNKATRNYTTGSYLILNNTLYKVTANIANGGNITPNTNVTATTIMAEFMSL